MDWSTLIGRPRPMAQDALRILTVVHQLGEPVQRSGIWTVITGESRLQHLEHLVRRPEDLAFVLLNRGPLVPGFAERRGDLIRRLGRLLSADSDSRHRGPRRFRSGSWERWDDILAFLGCRDLLRVRSLRDGSPRLGYYLTEAGAEYLEGAIYPFDPEVAGYRERCRLIWDFLGPELAPDRDLASTLQEVARRLESYCIQEQVVAEDDLLNHYCQSTLGFVP